MILRVTRIVDLPYIGCAMTAIQSMTEFLADEHPGSFSPLTATKKLTTVQRPYPIIGVAAGLEQLYGGTNS
jgi:hypothetical protein